MELNLDAEVLQDIRGVPTLLISYSISALSDSREWGRELNPPTCLLSVEGEEIGA